MNKRTVATTATEDINMIEQRDGMNSLTIIVIEMRCFD